MQIGAIFVKQIDRAPVEHDLCGSAFFDLQLATVRLNRNVRCAFSTLAAASCKSLLTRDEPRRIAANIAKLPSNA